MRLSFLFLLLFPLCPSAQTLTTVSTKWGDSFVEWDVYALLPVDTTTDTQREKSGKKSKKSGKKKGGLTRPKQDPEPDTEAPPPPADSIQAEKAPAPMPLQEQRYGELKLRWLNVRDDWSEWDFELGGERGTIRAKWKDDPTQWELRTYSGAIVSMRTMWPNDNTQWRVTDNSISLVLKSRWTNQLDEWLVDDREYGKLYLYTLRQQDPRDWAIEDEMQPTVSTPMKLAMVFLSIFQSTPKR